MASVATHATSAHPTQFSPAAARAAAWPVVGHEWAVRFLSQLTTPAHPADERGGSVGAPAGLRHAYLLLGPAHVGKTTLARVFIQSILCTDAAVRPCGSGTCRACTLMARGVHPDFHLIQPTDKDGEVDRVNGLLRAEVAESIVHDAALHPVEARYKVFLIQDAHRANLTFANKLLKTLEEPPANIVLCLTAVDRQQLLPTIVSRCQALELRPTPRQQIQQALMEQHGVAPDRADLLARLANGRMGWAVDQLTADDTRARHEQLDVLWSLIAAGSAARLEWAEKSATNRNSVHLFGMLELWVNWWRDILLYQAGCEDACNNIDHLPHIAACAASVSSGDVQAYLQTLQRIERYLHHTVNTRMALDVLALRLPHVADLPATAQARLATARA